MVKPTPKIRNALARRRKKFMELGHPKLRETLLLNLNTNSNSHISVSSTLSPSSSSNHLQQQQQQQQQQLIITENSNSKPQNESPFTPVQQPLKKKKRSRSPENTPSTYATCSSSSPPLSPSSLSSPLKTSPSFLIPSSNSPRFKHTHQLLRRTVSDPPIFYSDSTADDSSTSKKMTKVKQELSESPKVCRNLMGQLLPPLPPPPSPKLLRRTISEPVPLPSNTKEKKQKEEMKEQVVKTEKLSGEWTMIKLKCGCGSYFQFLYCAADNKCYKLV